MMTPSAKFQFLYEFTLEDGNKEFRDGALCYGAFEASQELQKHGLKELSYSTILNARKPRAYLINRLPNYDMVWAASHVVSHFNRIGNRLDIVDVHLVFQRV